MESRRNTLPPAPRHLKRRRFWQSTAAEAFPARQQSPAMVQEPLTEVSPAPEVRAPTQTSTFPVRRLADRQQRRRLVALTAVILTCLAIIGLLTALVFWA